MRADHAARPTHRQNGWLYEVCYTGDKAMLLDPHFDATRLYCRKVQAMPTRIMVVNDTQEILDLFRDILTEEGYEVFLYSYAIQDLAEVKRIKPDLIILDHIIGGEAVGWQMLQKLKMRRSTAKIPVVVCTAATNAVQEMEGYLKSKDVSLVLKPFDIDDLLLAIRTALTVHASPSYPQVGEKQLDEPSAAENKD